MPVPNGFTASTVEEAFNYFTRREEKSNRNYYDITEPQPGVTSLKLVIQIDRYVLGTLICYVDGSCRQVSDDDLIYWIEGYPRGGITDG